MGGRAAIYARFSSHNQRGESIEIQVEKSRAYCAENDLRVVATYCDFAQTGTNTDRAEFQRMMADAKRGLFDFVVIYKVTRIMRNRDEMAMARIMLRRCRVEILYAGEDISDGSAGVLQLGHAGGAGGSTRARSTASAYATAYRGTPSGAWPTAACATAGT